MDDWSDVFGPPAPSILDPPGHDAFGCPLSEDHENPTFETGGFEDSRDNSEIGGSEDPVNILEMGGDDPI